MWFVAAWILSRASKWSPFNRQDRCRGCFRCRRQGVDAQSGDLGALFGVGDLAIRRDAVLGSADGTDFGLDGEALVMGKVDKLGGLLDVFVEGEMRAVEHDGRESGGDAALGPFERAVIEMEGRRER